MRVRSARKLGGALACCVFLFVTGRFTGAVSAASFTNQISQYITYDWDIDDDLPHDSINAVIQTRDGYLWLATRQGLVRFDGVNSAVMDPVYFPELKQHAFTTLGESRDGVLWVGAGDGKLWRVKGGKSEEFGLPPSMTNGVLTRIFESADGSLWVGTETNGLLRIKGGQSTLFTTKDGLAHNSIRSICEDGEGGIWIATAGGVSCWKDGKFTNITSQNGLLHNSIRVVYFDRQGNLWIASHYGLTRLKNGEFTHFFKRDGLADNLINALFEDHQGVLWIGTFNGLNRMVEGRIYLEARADGTSYDRVHSILEDHEGDLIVANRDGLSRLKTRVVTAYTQQQGLTHNDATSVFEDRDGDLWVTFWGGGINRVRDGTVKAYSRRDGISSDLILTARQTRSGELWFGMDYDGGVNQLVDDKFIHYRELEGMHEHTVNAILEDSAGTLWIGTRTALLALRDGKFQRYTTQDGLPSDAIETIHEDHSGNMWFGTEGGLAVLREGKFVSFTTRDGLSNDFISSIHEDEQGTLWLATHGGLNRFRDRNFRAYTTSDGLARDELLTVTEDNLGYLWMGTRQGILRISKSQLNDFFRGSSGNVICVSYGKVDGMASVECKGHGETGAWRGRDGRIWFPTGKGVVAVEPRAAHINTNPPPVLIQALEINGQPTDISKPVRLVAGQQELVVRYTAFSLAAPEKITFKYKIEGLDQNWIHAGNAREARFNHLPAGSYKFRVIAANGDGVWNQAGASVGMIIAPPFWRTWWFESVAALVILGLVAASVRYVWVQKLQRQLASLEQQHAIEKERSRIAKDMHDDLGANLTQICILSELAKRDAQQPERVANHANAISDTARELVQSMDEIVWSANPRNDNLRKLSGYIFQYAEHFLAPTPIRARFEHPVSLPELPLSAELRHHLFLVVKEALNNVVKHSGASEVWLRLTLSDTELGIIIEDNGCGFSLDAGRAFGNGLANMKKRIEDISGKFELQCPPGGGTKIRVAVGMTIAP